MKKRGAFAGAGTLAVAVVIAKIAGAAYRVPLANMLGAEGMGIYQFVYPIFALLITLSSGSLPTAISISVSEQVALGKEEEAKKFFSAALKLGLFVGLSASILLALLAYPISLLQSTDAFPGYLAVAPAVVIVTLVSAFRGWFTGHGDLVPSSVSQITEGVVKMAVGLLLTHLLLPYGLPYAVVGALLGVGASEGVTLAIMLVFYGVRHKRFARVKFREEREQIKLLLKRMAPLVVCGMILPLSQFIDSLLLPFLLRSAGQENATAQYGVWSGMVTPLINLPVMVCISLGIAVTPQMVESKAHGDVERILQKSDTAVKLTFFMGIPFIIVYLIMAEKILGHLYTGMTAERLQLSSRLLRINAVGVLSLSLFQIHSAILQGLERMKVPAKIMAMSMAVKHLISVALTPVWGIEGAAVAAVVGSAVAGGWIIVYFVFFTRWNKRLVKNVSLITLSGVIMGMLIFMTAQWQTSLVSILLVGAFAGLLYLSSVLVARVFSREEWEAMPLSKMFVKLDKTINGD